ncbi:hypothetical protein PkoCFBP13504_10445 [Pseudomonas koreensis]|nr:hypothetical protein PkoCFBP13504_10445 [Pseudomonas koreensis]
MFCNPVGASLLAKASCQTTSTLDVPSPSRAGRIVAPSLPHGWVIVRNSCRPWSRACAPVH